MPVDGCSKPSALGILIPHQQDDTLLVVLDLVLASTTSTASTTSSQSRTRDLPSARCSNTRSIHPSFMSRASFCA